jgi:hypothetical protein
MLKALNDTDGLNQRCGGMRIFRWLFTPVLAPLLENRRILLIPVVAAALQVGLTVLGLPGWRCPVKGLFGIPCPGCGLSRATAHLIQGEWEAAIATHAFAPVFLAGFVLIVIVGLVPEKFFRAIVCRIETVERKTGLVGFVLVCMIIYWLIRLPGWL